MAAARKFGPESWWKMIEDLPYCSGVYAVFSGEKLLYVGKTGGCIYIRLRQHNLKEKFVEMEADHVEFIACDNSQHLDYMETWFIAKYRPVLNSNRGGAWLSCYPSYSPVYSLSVEPQSSSHLK